ncbi:D-amino-acid oxidase-like protein [Thermochaetoides thermophila DSM 1495]|uniref:D-amino-acid oxidase-like protein n=1 Tax=Chaetomium thermophilum (strain DSM 1495 / CBS 144.50 / IMI 039719) TaxID=759272 RepID=G0SF31_CHATD|nr:D-amino-acid oxidase-like protein [Thermochaetoides thermophila DSM 1495]EGS18047.1 D-amino-acid oxidase-like protein [Thermochaetoides thermophila DSM 1495]
MRSLYSSHGALTGLTFLDGIEYLDNPGPEYLNLSASMLPADCEYQVLSKEELPEGVKWGCRYRTWCVNPMVYLQFLLRRFVHRGGKLLKRELRHPLEAFSLQTVSDASVGAVVNASGYGLPADPAVYPIRGQTVLVASSVPYTITRQHSDPMKWTFCIPRGLESGTIIGGTKEPHDWESNPRPETRAELLSRMKETYAKIVPEGKDGVTVLRDIVGRRWAREGGPRVEGEVLQEGRFVMHAYGLGGRGYEVSWGVAEEVVRGVKGFLERGVKL